MNKSQETITVPKKSFQNFLKIVQGITAVYDEMEDYVMFQDADFLKRMRRAREEDRKGLVTDWKTLRKKYAL